MIQTRMAGDLIGRTGWIDIVSEVQTNLMLKQVKLWREDGFTREQIRFEFRVKPNVFVRIKEYFLNE